MSEAREFIKVHAYDTKGTHCPCCKNFVKSYRRPLNHDMARFVIMLVRVFERTGDWVDITSFNFRGGDYAKAEFWGLVEHKPNTDDPEKKESGMWKPTKLGQKVAYKLESIPKYAHLNWNGEFEGHSGPNIFIDQALKKKFNYAELMSY